VVARAIAACYQFATARDSLSLLSNRTVETVGQATLHHAERCANATVVFFQQPLDLDVENVLRFPQTTQNGASTRFARGRAPS